MNNPIANSVADQTAAVRAKVASVASIPGRKLAQVRVMIRLPPSAVSIRRMVVPIGSEGVTPQRGWPPKDFSVSTGRSTVIEA